MEKNKGFAPIVIVIAVVALLVIGGGAYFVGKSSKTAPQNENNLPPMGEVNNVNNPITNSNTPTQGQTTTTTVTTTTTKSWKSGTFSNISFEYPIDFTFTIEKEEWRVGTGHFVDVGYLKQNGTSNQIQFGGYFGSSPLSLGCDESGYGYDANNNISKNIHCVPPSKTDIMIFTASQDSNFLNIFDQIIATIK